MAGAAGDLGDELEGSLVGAEVGQMEGLVGREDPDQRDAREIEALGDHLRADEHIELLVLEGGERLLVVLAPAHGVRVHARDACAGHEARELGLDALACAGVAEPSRHTAFARRARSTATSRAW